MSDLKASISGIGALPVLTGDSRSWANAHLISAEQITKEGLDLVLSVAEQMKVKVATNGKSLSLFDNPPHHPSASQQDEAIYRVHVMVAAVLSG